MKRHNRRVLAASSVEILDYDNAKALEIDAEKAWPDVTYAGHPIIDGHPVKDRYNYYDQFDEFTKAALRHYDHFQEAYTGYDVKNDQFISGVEGWIAPEDYFDDEDEGDEAVSVFRMKWDRKNGKLWEIEIMEDTGYSLYDRNGLLTIKGLHKMFRGLADLRLD